MSVRRSVPVVLAVVVAGALAACSDADQAITSPRDAEPRMTHGGVCVDFNVPPLGTAWGGAFGTPVGVTQWVENGIRVSVVPYQNGGVFFGEARIVFPPVAFGAGPVGRARSINWQFDFTGLTFVPRTVTFQWLDQGTPSPVENLGVNGSPLFIGQLHAPPAAFGPVLVSSVFGAAPGGLTGTIRLWNAPIQRVVVGGQPVWIDHVCAYP